MHLNPKPDTTNFPEVRSLTPVEKGVVRRFIYGQWGVGVLFGGFLICITALPLVVVSDGKGGGTAIFVVMFIVVSLIGIAMIVSATKKRNEQLERLDGPVREARGILRADQPAGSLGVFPMLHGREVLVPYAWHDELPRLREVYALVVEVSDDIWVPVEMNGWLSLERDAEAGILDTWLPPGRAQFLNLLQLFRGRMYSERYRRLRKKERQGELTDAYTSTEEARTL